jgi:hypothetical protein
MKIKKSFLTITTIETTDLFIKSYHQLRKIEPIIFAVSLKCALLSGKDDI